MTIKTLNDRVLEAKALASLGKIESRDKHGRVRTVIVPGSEATQNRVIIRRFNGGIISCECGKVNDIGTFPCPGNVSGVCRHSIAAIIIAMADQSYTPRFRKNLDQARRYARQHADVTLSNPDTGEPVVLTLKSHTHAKHMIHFIAIEDSAIALKKVA